jgi:hypothetical protein
VDEQQYLTARESAAIRRKTEAGLAWERAHDPYSGPPFVIDGRRVLYPKDEHEAYMAGLTRKGGAAA